MTHTPEEHDVLSAAVDDGARIALEFTADGDDVAAHIGVGTQYHVTEYGDHGVTDVAIDIGITQDGDGCGAHRPGDVGAAQHRDHGIIDLAGTGRGAQH